MNTVLAAETPSGEKKVLVADMAEYNPRFDIDNQTARSRSATGLDHRPCPTLINAAVFITHYSDSIARRATGHTIPNLA